MEIGKTTESGPAGPARASAAPRDEIKRERCVSTSLQAALLKDNRKINNTQATANDTQLAHQTKSKTTKSLPKKRLAGSQQPDVYLEPKWLR